MGGRSVGRPATMACWRVSWLGQPRGGARVSTSVVVAPVTPARAGASTAVDRVELAGVAIGVGSADGDALGAGDVVSARVGLGVGVGVTRGVGLMPGVGLTTGAVLLVGVGVGVTVGLGVAAAELGAEGGVTVGVGATVGAGVGTRAGSVVMADGGPGFTGGRAEGVVGGNTGATDTTTVPPDA